MADPSQDKKASSATILVVDDNKEVVKLLLLLLSHHGFSAIGANSGQECLELVHRQPVDLVILDVMMPEMDGITVCQELKRTAPSLPVILLTARDDMGTRAKAMALGVSEFIAKPVNNQDLICRVQTQLKTRQMGKDLDRNLSSIQPREKKTPSANNCDQK